MVLWLVESDTDSDADASLLQLDDSDADASLLPLDEALTTDVETLAETDALDEVLGVDDEDDSSETALLEGCADAVAPGDADALIDDDADTEEDADALNDTLALGVDVALCD